MFQAQIGLIRKLRISAVLAGIFLFLIFGLAIFPVASSVDDTQAESRQSETTLTVSTEDLDLAFEINAVNGSFAEASANVSVTTNNYTGYTLNIITGNIGTDAGKLVGEHSSFNTISSVTASADFAADTATEMNGLWGYKPSKVNGEANTSYLPAPTELTTIEQTDAANANANTYTIGLGARADLSYEAGAYVNTFVITSVANPVSYTITYDKNTEDEVTNMPEDQDGSTSGTTITLADNVPVRVGYDFMGWCDGAPNGANCTGTIYQAGDDYDIDQTTGNLKTLYALWGHVVTFDDAYADAGKSRDTTSNKYYLHEMTPAICSAVSTGQTGQLVDVRDGTVYNVGKLADERCWLLDNLALDLTATGASTNITSANTNAHSAALDALFGTATRDASTDQNGNLAIAGVADWNNHSGFLFSTPLINKESKDLTNSSDPIEVIRTSKYGIYYNYCAASAGSYCYGKGESYGTSYDKPDTLIDAEYDICPAGWRLPTSTSSGEYQALFSAYNSNGTNFRTALLAPLSGGFIDSDFYARVRSQGEYGTFLSSTRSTDIIMYGAMFSSSDVSPSSNPNRHHGDSVRCIARDGNEPVTTFDDAYAAAGKSKDTTSGKYQLQEMTPAICSAVTTGQTGQLVDIRDSKKYTVSKENDGRCWMTQNLSLELSTSKTLTHADTDVGWTSADTTATWTPTRNTSTSAGTVNVHNQTVPYVDWTGTNTAPDSAYYSGYYYYDWTAAIASNDSSWITDQYAVAPDSICPAGWRLPKGVSGESQTEEDASEWNKLLVAQGVIDGWAKTDDSFNHDGVNITFGGSVFEGDIYPPKWIIWGIGSNGNYWTSSSTGSGAYQLRVYSSTVGPASKSDSIYGYSIRCLARDGNEPIVTTSFDEAYARSNKTKDTTSDKYKLSDMSTSICSAVTAGQTGQLVDVRDGTVYNVGKLADGRCWTLDNLALDLTDSTVQSNMSSSNTNANTTSLNALFGTTVRDVTTDPDGNLATAGVADWTTGISGSSFSAPLMNKEYKDTVNSSDEIEVVRASKYGIYYNYCAASAGSYCYGNSADYDRPDTLVDTEYDICPAGWRMPTGGNLSEYSGLINAYNSDTNNLRTAFLVPFSGGYSDVSPSGNSNGFFWSSTWARESRMLGLSIYSNPTIHPSPSGASGRQGGRSVRCIAK